VLAPPKTFLPLTELKEMLTPTSEVPNQPFALGEYLDRVDVPNPKAPMCFSEAL
jgi:hypothetical protein